MLFLLHLQYSSLPTTNGQQNKAMTVNSRFYYFELFKFSLNNVVLVINASLNAFAPSALILFSAKTQFINSFSYTIHEPILIRSNWVNAVFIFNASLSFFNPSSPMLLTVVTPLVKPSFSCISSLFNHNPSSLDESVSSWSSVLH